MKLFYLHIYIVFISDVKAYERNAHDHSTAGLERAPDDARSVYFYCTFRVCWDQSCVVLCIMHESRTRRAQRQRDHKGGYDKVQ